MKIYHNPVIPGFHPDPSVTRVGDEYYLVNSSFQWFPGIPIYRSKNLVDWHPVGYALTRRSQLDISSIQCSLGIWAPDIQYYDGIFYLVYTDVRRYNKHDRRDKLIENKLVTATEPSGPWSDPVLLNDSGIDPGLFRDDDGRMYLVNQIYGPDTFSKGIVCQEFDPMRKELIGEAKIIWPGTEAGFTEGPHLYKRSGMYYLLTAEGGTYINHQCSLVRSENLWGPYETIQGVSILTMKDKWKEVGISRSGHGDFIEIPGDGWYIVFLAARPYGGEYANLGRETFLLPVRWTDEGWPVVNEGRGVEFECPFPPLPETESYKLSGREDFDSNELPFEWNFCRNPIKEGYSLTERPGFLRIRGCEHDLSELAHTNLIARRQSHINFTAETIVDFNPENETAEAGLTCCYDTREYYKLAVTLTGGQRVVKLVCHRTDAGPGKDKEIVTDKIHAKKVLPETGAVLLKIEAKGQDYRFFAGGEDCSLEQVGIGVDGSILSDEHISTFGWGFTGAFVGVYAIDRSGGKTPADFDWFEYREN